MNEFIVLINLLLRANERKIKKELINKDNQEANKNNLWDTSLQNKKNEKS
jgi:hypothetical protein